MDCAGCFPTASPDPLSTLPCLTLRPGRMTSEDCGTCAPLPSSCQMVQPPGGIRRNLKGRRREVGVFLPHSLPTRPLAAIVFLYLWLTSPFRQPLSWPCSCWILITRPTPLIPSGLTVVTLPAVDSPKGFTIPYWFSQPCLYFSVVLSLNSFLLNLFFRARTELITLEIFVIKV